jgi:hypothetical protein
VFDCSESGVNTVVTISSGYFTVDPIEYCGTKDNSDNTTTQLFGVASNNATYPWTVGEKQVDEETSVTVAEPTVADLPKADITTAADLCNAANVVGSKANAIEALTGKGISATAENAAVVVKPYLDIKVDSVTMTGDTKTMTMDISAMCDVVATTDASNPTDANSVSMLTGGAKKMTNSFVYTAPVSSSNSDSSDSDSTSGTASVAQTICVESGKGRQGDGEQERQRYHRQRQGGRHSRQHS